MAYWARIIKAEASWDKVSDLISNGALPLAALADFLDSDDRPSIWLIDEAADLDRSLLRIAAAQQKGTEPSKIAFRIITSADLERLEPLGIRKPLRDNGDTFDHDLNMKSHFTLQIETVREAIILTRAYMGPEKIRRFTKAQVGDAIAASIREGHFALSAVKHVQMRNWLVNNDKLIVRP